MCRDLALTSVFFKHKTLGVASRRYEAREAKVGRALAKTIKSDYFGANSPITHKPSSDMPEESKTTAETSIRRHAVKSPDNSNTCPPPKLLWPTYTTRPEALSHSLFSRRQLYNAIRALVVFTARMMKNLTSLVTMVNEFP
ncbi:hypothetical protein DVU_2002 [Nitratidesulfovibrio vulgaris str. Hildenborough]|uniref:Uncharacterized protein n=1 Tax=Nitratidesulfovibrio vulgaris (strain ATCC 29579 / DSM 644 / CCUG 34227 / NCIMB 8303 / VKM B-1760 / Hildenborough) TaxID=882 RepID=Q72AJ1_NITV2|nr:hypothetical protein DVU_2002 [Nitratidesulfovibrio vulgaris str. Hildenborough]